MRHVLKMVLPAVAAVLFLLPNPAYAKVAEASFVSNDDRVLAVTIGSESVAYPIRIMAYHHLVHDTVGGTPIVATY